MVSRRRSDGWKDGGENEGGREGKPRERRRRRRDRARREGGRCVSERARPSTASAPRFFDLRHVTILRSSVIFGYLAHT